MPSTLRGRVVLVTGAARGIGAEVARVAAARGARVAAIGLEPERLAALCAELGDGHAWAECDVTDGSALARAVDDVVARLGGIDIVLANAGVATRGTVRVSPMEAQARVIAVNLVGVMRTAHATLPHLLERRGYLLLVSSAAAFSALPGMAPYAASKAGVEQYGNVLRLEVAHLGVDVGVAHPSWIDTDLVRDVQADSAAFREAMGRLPGPVGRVTDLRTCAEAMVDAMERRSRRLFVPRSLRWLARARALLSSPWVERLALRMAGESVARAEAETLAHGRHFGVHSTGMGTVPGDGPGGVG